jgi:hypothetical protein
MSDKTQFQCMVEKEIRCDICGGLMLPWCGGGWDNDRMVCVERDCEAEIVFPTSTEAVEVKP